MNNKCNTNNFKYSKRSTYMPTSATAAALTQAPNTKSSLSLMDAYDSIKLTANGGKAPLLPLTHNPSSLQNSHYQSIKTRSPI